MDPAAQPWPSGGPEDLLVLVDFSGIAYACWAPAEAAEEAGKKALLEHQQRCPTWAGMVATGNDVADCCPDLPRQYDAREVLKTNLRQKMGTLEELTGASPNRFVMALDSRCQWRYDLFPAYKSGRGEKRVDPRPAAMTFLAEAYPGMRWVRAAGYEADDVIATLARQAEDKQGVSVVSCDKDLWQLYGTTANILNPATKKWLDYDTVADKFHGLGPQHIRLVKAFWGDSSDALPNCAPRQQKQLVPLIRKAEGDLRRLGELRAQVSDSCFQLLAQNHKQIAVNWRLAGLSSNVPLEWVTVEVAAGRAMMVSNQSGVVLHEELR